ncbi:hypothetical protein ABVK25_008033 [Lepraria finkii]|uniref:JmjC domain-containing protein n=1 Tax=Lepraria finkii TaxID=1340010 RepID=A0ABR4B413_9LECA
MRLWMVPKTKIGRGAKRGARVEVGGGDAKEKENAWGQEAVRLLDMAVIIAGAARREERGEELVGALQNYVEEQELDPGPPRKKRRRGEEDSAFPMTEGKNVPEIRKPIPTVSNMSTASFEKHLKTGSPLVIRDALTHWPALHERPWKNPEYLLKRTFGGRRLIPVEIGRSYTDEGWGQKIVTFREFMDGCLLHGLPDEPDGKAAPSSSLGYLAQHDLFTQIPSLRNDIYIPDYCYTDPPPPSSGTPLASQPPTPQHDEPMLHAWLGPAGPVSPLHPDTYYNVLCQVVGKKYVRLYAPTESEKVYPKGVEGGGIDMSNTSEVDVEDVDPVRFPLFEKAEYVECILKAGECLYIPVGWWHYVRSLTVSFSVSFWWN